MVEQWIIDKLTPLKGEKLIILADPQRMIRAGAQAVDGWAKEHNRSGGTSVVRVARPRVHDRVALALPVLSGELRSKQSWVSLVQTHGPEAL